MQRQEMIRFVVTSIGVSSLTLMGCTQSTVPNQQAQAPTITPESTAPSPVAPVKRDVVYVPTPQEVVDKMLELAAVTKDDLVYDLGSGDGRIVITAAKEYGARGIGIEIDPELIQTAQENAQAAGVSDQVEFRQQDLFQTDFSDATVVTLYLLSSLNEKLRPKLLQELKPGTRIVSHSFAMGDWKPEQVVTVKTPSGERTVYFWQVPETVPENLR
jgi:SAM-dependent methyltransferase